MSNAVELTVDAAWYIADVVGAGSFPWALAITPPYRDVSERAAFTARQIEDLTQLGVIVAGTGRIDPEVTDWIKAVCYPDRWLELRYVGVGSGVGGPAMLRGFVARRGERTVVALRSARSGHLHLDGHRRSSELVPVLAAGLSSRAPARFAEFAMPAKVGARADEQLRGGADLAGVLELPEHSGVRPPGGGVGVHRSTHLRGGRRRPASRGHPCDHRGRFRRSSTHRRQGARQPVEGVRRRMGVDLRARNPFAIALAVDSLTATLPDGQWFPAARLARTFP